jgi:hypothetical protein
VGVFDIEVWFLIYGLSGVAKTFSVLRCQDFLAYQSGRTLRSVTSVTCTTHGPWRNASSIALTSFYKVLDDGKLNSKCMDDGKE